MKKKIDILSRNERCTFVIWRNSPRLKQTILLFHLTLLYLYFAYFGIYWSRREGVSAFKNIFQFTKSEILECFLFQIYTVRSERESTTVVVKGPSDRDLLTFRLKDQGSLISIKFSLKQKILALQRTESVLVSCV